LPGKKPARPLVRIDLVCINQDDLAQRQYQVGLMDFIYSRAEQVLIWLCLPMPDLVIEDGTAPMVPDGLESKNLEICCTWSWNHTYWGRVWIVQEIALARQLQVCVGKHDMSWTYYVYTLKRHRSFKVRERKYGSLMKREKVAIVLQTDWNSC
jgi:Heterokaryon incompatibility protein (HET)